MFFAAFLLLLASAGEPWTRIHGLVERGLHAEAQQEARDLLEQVEREQGPDSLPAAEVATVLLAAELELLGRDKPAAELVELARRVVAIREREQGPEHPDLVQSLVALGRLEGRSERPSEAVTHFERALAVQTKVFGSDELAVATILEYLGRALREAGRLEEALARFERTLEIRAAQSGPASLEASHSLNALANLTAQMGRYDESRGYFERLVAVREALLGPNDLEVAYALGNYAVLHLRQDAYDAAVPLLRRSLSIVEAVRGPDHPDVAHGLVNLGITSMKTGDYTAARDCLERALAIRERAHGEEHLDTIAARLQLATLLRELGDYEAARPLYERALAHWESGVENHPLRADGQNNYAMLLADMGDRAEARRLYEAALAVKEEVYGPTHRSVAHTLNNLGVLLLEDGDLEGARSLLVRALSIKEDALGVDHLSTASTLVPLGELLAAAGDSAGARERLERALAIQERELGPEHPTVATTLTALARLLADLGRVDEARELLERARRIREQALGADHPLVAQSLERVAALALKTADAATGLEAGLTAERIDREHVQTTARVLAEREALRYAAVRSSGLSTALSLASTPAAVERVWDSAIRSRSLVLDEMLLRQRALRETGDAELVRLARRLQNARDQLARIVLRGPVGDDAAGYRRLLDWSQREKEEAERALARHSASERPEAWADRPGFTEMRKALGKGEAIVAYVRYRHGPAAVDSYLAFVLPSSESAPALVRLGPASDIDAAIRAWRTLAGTKPPAIRRLREEAEERCREAGVELRARVWDPVASHLTGAELVFIVTDGALSFVPFTALPSGEDGYLLETSMRMHHLATERDLVQQARPTPADGLLLVGSPEFGAGPPVRFRPLPASSAEIDEIAALWRRERAEDRVDQRKGQGASEAAVKAALGGHLVLHLATHSYTTSSDAPLALAGLALAGANDGPSSRGEDGILTVEEIGSLDLSGTEWVVLSACETGLGELHEGEGLLGLRRAFQVAGARTLITSLWSVQDEATRAWMSELYRARLDGSSTAESVRRAGVSVLESRRAAGLGTHPFHWAAFVAAGDWR